MLYGKFASINKYRGKRARNCEFALELCNIIYVINTCPLEI